MKNKVKNALIGALSGYSFTAAPIWEIRENMFLIGVFFSVLVWILMDWLDKKYTEWWEENGSKVKKIKNYRLQRRKSKRI